ncbi:MAG: hypothetical protein PVG67_12325, partial [Desulfobacterales bacterium]
MTKINNQNVFLSVTQQKIKGMVKLLEEMANAIRSGDSSHEVETNSAIILAHLSDILDAMANSDDRAAYLTKTQQNIEVEKEWNPWNEMVEH